MRKIYAGESDLWVLALEGHGDSPFSFLGEKEEAREAGAQFTQN